MISDKSRILVLKGEKDSEICCTSEYNFYFPLQTNWTRQSLVPWMEQRCSISCCEYQIRLPQCYSMSFVSSFRRTQAALIFSILKLASLTQSVFLSEESLRVSKDTKDTSTNHSTMIELTDACVIVNVMRPINLALDKTYNRDIVSYRKKEAPLWWSKAAHRSCIQRLHNKRILSNKVS